MSQPRRVGKYEILAELGRGGFATVYKARDVTLDRVVALKILHLHVTDNPAFIQRFQQEARTAANLHHSHIVTVYEVGEQAGQHYIAMTFLLGQTLDELLAVAKGPLPLEQTVSIVEQIAGALDYIHERKLVHRDVKPSNIMVGNAGQVALLDFGIVRAASGTPLTTTGAVMGTPQYMSPEQADGDEVDTRSDIYSLGVMTYQMCTGKAPFDAVSPLVVLRLHVDKPPPAPRKLNPQLSPGVERVLLIALAKSREKRYQSAGEMAWALRQAMEAEAQARRQKKQLEELYRQALAKAKNASWAEVENLCQRIEALAGTGYRNTDRLLRRAQKRLRQERAKAIRKAQPLPIHERFRRWQLGSVPIWVWIVGIGILFLSIWSGLKFGEWVIEKPLPPVFTPAPTRTIAPPTPIPTTTPSSTPTPDALPSATPTFPPTPSRSPTGQMTYMVQPGDNIFRIALRHGTTVDAITSANGISNPAMIYVGQVLIIPSLDSQPSSGIPSGTTHVVQPGENLFRIALRYNMSYVYLAQYNDIANPAGGIYVGQVLRIP